MKNSTSISPVDSSVGRAVDCSGVLLVSIGRWFDSGSTDAELHFHQPVDSSVGRAVDCSGVLLVSIGRWFDSGSTAGIALPSARR
ncbi:hypothetical protein CEXT_698071 [Caerostris extrusa]|uniref:Uncharacterized protein n=1 Tax=Caerostris extrusa TaxID=172846 RepID=A0AAV4UKI5_CAEEX|nr:hypothetical protein CEXT_698071 [Caerostris extrusa]